MATDKNRSENYRVSGITAIAISASVYGSGFLMGLKEDSFFGIFLLNYLISVTYFLALLFSGQLKQKESGLDNFLLSLVLFLISAYALNCLIPVFESSVPWLTISIILVGAVYCFLGYWNKLPIVLKHVLTFILGIGLVLFLYLSIYLLPVYPVSIPGILLLGISLHSFVPIFLFAFSLKWIIIKIKSSPNLKWSFIPGIISPIIIVIVFSIGWHNLNKLVGNQYQHSLIEEQTELPVWIRIARILPDNRITEKYLKADLVYSIPKQSNGWINLSMPQRDFDEVRKHDPLIVIASLLSPARTLNEEERIKILESGFDARHKTQERLWRGDDLSTTNVISNIRIWPQFRIAYTEQTITVANSGQERWRNEQEAIYTFHLPEGGVVTSLSLWINGIEEKGMLTTKGNADSAYKQIVGVESRDPSVVHWQEGNTVSVRVFPVMANNSRIFKIGITAPLTFTDKKLKYAPIYFDGPDAGHANEIVKVDWDQQPEEGVMDGFVQESSMRFSMERNYKKDWELQFAAPEISEHAFSFNHNTYHIQPYYPERGSIDFKKVYLDINATWSPDEFEEILQLLKSYKVYAFQDQMITVTEANARKVFDQLHRQHFSLFPLQEISSPERALLITKSGLTSPNISDLKGTPFAQHLETWLQKGEKICLYNIGNQLSPYLKTLKEHRAFLYEQGDINLLKNLVQNHEFVLDAEDTNHVVIDNAGIVLNRTQDTARSNAPDHFLRLFAYNHLMQQMKKGIFTNLEADSTLVTWAQEAYIVTPLSSLIVLETTADYERFDIKASKNSLQNASMKSKGAVPEPHEWALIILTAALVICLRYKNTIKRLHMPSPDNKL